MRSILAAATSMYSRHDSIYCFLKGGESPGWIAWDTLLDQEDEISLAHKVKKNWQEIFTEGTLGDLVKLLNAESLFLLGETGDQVNNWKSFQDYVLVLGAQSDLTEDDKLSLGKYSQVTLGKDSMLASQVILLTRQMIDQSLFSDYVNDSMT